MILKTKLEKITRSLKAIIESTEKNYRQRIVKKQGKCRILHIPNEQIKDKQKEINYIFQQNLKKPIYLYTGYKKCKMLDVIDVHKKAKTLIVLDIQNFYANVKAERILNFFTQTCELETETAHFLFKIVTYNKKLPLGTPTSSLLSFWACKDVFDEIFSFCKSLGLQFTLYADDMVVSGDIKNPPAIISKVQKTLAKAGLKLNYQKMRIYGKRKRIMNIHIDQKGKLSIDNKLRNSIKDLQNKKSLSEREKLALKGKVAYKKYIENTN